MKKASCSLSFALVAVLTSGAVSAAIQQHSFAITGDNGESGTGSFTWDDETVPVGSSVGSTGVSGTGAILSLTMTISGGNVFADGFVPGSTITFTLADCSLATADLSPDFQEQLNFDCESEDGLNYIFPVGSSIANLNETATTLTFTPGTTSSANPATSVPTLPFYGLMALGSLLGLLGLRKLKA